MFNLILLALSTIVAICFGYFVCNRMWALGRRERVYCVLVFGVTLMMLVFAWTYAGTTGLFSTV